MAEISPMLLLYPTSIDPCKWKSQDRLRKMQYINAELQRRMRQALNLTGIH